MAAKLAVGEDDRIDRGTIAHLVEAGDEGRDTVHQLVMDVHRQLNALADVIAVETVDSATAFGLSDADRRLLRAFMHGVNETSPLKFDHPGLTTTAARAGDRLTIQNDLGTTDAHVIVVHVSDLQATVTYSDVHRRRARFFAALLEPFHVEFPSSTRWSGVAEHAMNTCAPSNTLA